MIHHAPATPDASDESDAEVVAAVAVANRDRIEALEDRLGPLEDKVIGLERALGDLDAATTAGITDNVDRIIALESRLADR